MENNNISNGAITLVVYLQMYLENYTNRIIMEKGRNIRNSDIVKITGISRQHIYTLLKELEKNNIIKIIGEKQNKKMYLNPNIVIAGTEIQKKTYNMFK